MRSRTRPLTLLANQSMPVQPCTAHQGRRGIATAGRRGAGEGICAPILLVGVHHSPYQGIPPLPVHALAAMKVLAKKCCNSNQGGLSTAPMIGLVIVAGVAIIGAPVAGMAYVTSEKGPARTWLAAAVLIICSGGVVRSVEASADLG